MDASDLSLPDLLPDVKVSQLNAAEQLIIGTLRLCVLDVKSGSGTGIDWHEELLTAGIVPCGVVAFGMFVQVLLIQTGRPLDIGCPFCQRLGKDEVRLLHLIGLLQQLRAEEASDALDAWVSLWDRKTAIRLIAHFAIACAGRKLIVSGSRWYGSPEPVASVCGDRHFSRLVH